MQSNKGRRWAILQLMVLLQGFIPQQLRLMLLWEKYVNRAFTHFMINLIHQRHMHYSRSILFKVKTSFDYCSVFNTLGSGFMHLPEHFLVFAVIFPWLLILSPRENGESYSFANAIK